MRRARQTDILTVVTEIPVRLSYEATVADKPYWVIDTRDQIVMYGYVQEHAAHQRAAFWNDMTLKIGTPLQYLVIKNPLMRR